MKLRLVIWNVRSEGEKKIEDIYEIEVKRTSSGKFDATTQWIMDKYLTILAAKDKHQEATLEWINYEGGV